MKRILVIASAIFAFGLAVAAGIEHNATEAMKTGSVYLGYCDPRTGWTDASFESLPTCDKRLQQGFDTGLKVKAIRGTKIRDRAPITNPASGVSHYGEEIGRIKKGVTVQLKSMTRMDDRMEPGSYVYWGEVQF